MEKIRHFFEILFGGINMTWPKVIIYAVAAGVYTALMALLVRDGNSFHDIVVTPEAWVLLAIIVIVNTKKPLEAALKTFVFFLISQPLVYLIQVPFNSMGWSLFKYYPYWGKITLLTLPGAFIGWFIKKKKFYAGIILSVMTVLLIWIGTGYVRGFSSSFPDHLLSAIYCFGIIPVFIIFILKEKWARIIATIISVIALLVILFADPLFNGNYYETYRNSFLEENGITLVGEPYISYWSGNGKETVEIIDVGDGEYNFRISGYENGKYKFGITDESGTEYLFNYYFDKDQNTMIVEKAD